MEYFSINSYTKNYSICYSKGYTTGKNLKVEWIMHVFIGLSKHHRKYNLPNFSPDPFFPHPFLIRVFFPHFLFPKLFVPSFFGILLKDYMENVMSNHIFKSIELLTNGKCNMDNLWISSKYGSFLTIMVKILTNNIVVTLCALLMHKLNSYSYFKKSYCFQLTYKFFMKN